MHHHSIRRAGLAGLLLGFLVLAGCLSSAGPEAPTITEQPKDRTGFVTQVVRFDVGLTGKAPFSFQWLRDGVPIAGANGSTYTTPTLTAADDGAKFSIRVTNASGSVTSNAATLTVKGAPVITTSPNAASVSAGASASFTVTASGDSLTYQWLRDDVPITGATAATYTISATAATDDGAVFTAAVINPGGVAYSQSATLTVAAAPAISVQPVGQTAAVGEPVILGVRASGGNLRYQWQREGVDIPGANAEIYRLDALTVADEGASFRVVVSNAQGTVTSATAVVRTLDAAAAPIVTAAASLALSQSGSTVGGFALVLRSTGAIAGWGYNANGQRGNGTTSDPSDTVASVTLPSGRRATAIAAGGFHALALLDNGDVVTWGLNEAGQLGLGDTAIRSLPTRVALPRPAIAIAAGRFFSLALLDDGRVMSWGANTLGQLGDGSREVQTSPVFVAGLTDVVAIAAGNEHALALRVDGAVWAWGANAAGQLGDGRYKPARTPIPTGLTNVLRIRAGGDTSIALSARRVAYLAGENSDGQLGLGSTVTTDVGVFSAVVSGVIDAATSDRLTLVLGAEGLLKATGLNESGSLGDGGTTARRVFGPVSVVSNGIALAAGGRSFAAAVSADGTTYTWGDNTSKQLGNASLPTTGTSTPTAVPSFDAIP